MTQASDDVPEQTADPRRVRVAVVFGGRSAEHAISCISAGSVIAALDPARYDVVPIGIATDGRWVLEDPQRNLLALGADGALPQVRGTDEVQLVPSAAPSLVARAPGAPPRELGDVDVVFPVMHGPFGQDGTLQGLLEMAGVHYVGAGVLASAVGTDKVFMKRLFEAAGLPVVPSVAITPREWERDRAGVRARIDALGLPVFVKPARAGSSFGISRVDRAEDLDAALEAARQHDPKVLVEAAAAGAREIEIGVLQGEGAGDHRTSAIAEIHVSGDHAFYDFEAKYLPEENTAFDVPARLDDAVERRVREAAVRAFDALDCEGLARVDFFLMPDGALLVNEVETMPGFTSLSMFPQLWAAVGVDYATLVEGLIAAALSRATGLR